ncbi:MAG TPA: argininosuccinate lyase [Gammaproteobacteria bacterium]|nr:argininosuccinate lyase [Gammaproteobacteria bacterium]
MNDSDTPAKPWSGRFAESTDALVERFTASVDFDQRLAPYDIRGSVAHARMLTRAGVLTHAECDAIVSGLEAIGAEIEAGTFDWSDALEDVHMNIEAALTRRVGAAGRKLHTARSRNDQVATDVRLLVRDEIDEIAGLIRLLQSAVLDKAEQHADTIMPGFTHLQTAQPVTFGHHLMAWFEMLDRDAGRLFDCRRRMNRSPLGAAALAGTGFPIDRDFTAQALGFDAPCGNSIDAVSDRDFLIELLSALALLMMHLSRMSEELILWSSAQFQFVSLSDAFCTGSSIMPQKKNPDVPELVRGKSGRVYGHLLSLLVLMKAQPLAYNRDNQEDKLPLFDAVDTAKDCLRIYAGMLPAVNVDGAAMRAAALKGYATATDLADYLVRKAIPFRDAHEIVGRAVKLAIDAGCDLSELPLKQLKALCDRIDKDVYSVLTVEGAVAARDHFGATAPSRVKAAIKHARDRLEG